MNKPFVFILGSLALGIVAGVVMMNAQDDETRTFVSDSNVAVDAAVEEFPRSSGLTQNDGLATGFDAVTNGSVGPIRVLEGKLARMEARILKLEQKFALKAGIGAKDPANPVANPLVKPLTNAQVSAANFSANRFNRMLTMQSLIKAGISEEMAADIVRRRNEIELGKLELADHAAREDYVGTPRYERELSALMTENISLREELGDDAYDRYLYVNRQPNRVKATSVMLGSAAELAGMKDGDIILTYGELRVFDWGELKQATSKGELDEYVNVDILRDGQLMSLWVPRGPLGVMLGAARVEPN